MEKLNNLISKACLASELGKKGINVDLTMLSQVRDEFWVLERRAEAAEAAVDTWRKESAYNLQGKNDAREYIRELEGKLAEIEQQKPVAYVMGEDAIDDFNSGYEFFAVRDAEYEEEMEIIPLYARLAPAVSMAELVPAKKSTDIDYAYYPLTKARHEGYNQCVDDILRNIEEAK